jgi:hypothetical protein
MMLYEAAVNTHRKLTTEERQLITYLRRHPITHERPPKKSAPTK